MCFKSDLFSGNLGESIQMFMLAKHIPQITSIKLPTSEGVNSRDVTIVVDSASGQFNIDMKTDFFAYKSKNCVFEIVSQFKPKHLKGKAKLQEMFSSSKYECSGEILKQIMSQLVSNKELKRFSHQEKGWLIKDYESNRRVTSWPVPFTQKELNDKYPIVEKYLTQLYCSDQDLGINQVQALRDQHDQLMSHLHIKHYKFYVMEKEKMFDFLKDTFGNSAYRVCPTKNFGYYTLNYLIPFHKFSKNKWCKEFAWKAHA